MSSSGENEKIDTLGRDELIAGVIQKHKRLLDEYSTEFEELDKRISSLNEQIDSAKGNRTNVVQRTEVLKEKRQQLYHQVEHMLEETVESIGNDKIDRRAVTSIKDGIAELKSLLDPEKEKQIDGMIMDNFSALPTDAQSLVSQIKLRLDNALEAGIELASTVGSESGFDEEQTKLKTELKEITPRHKWLENRIKSHREAAEYWEGSKKAADDKKVVAS